MSLLQVKNVSIQFGGILALQDVSFNVEEGEVVSIIGPNGAGKSTVFNCITGIYTPTSGEIRFNQELISGKKTYQLAQKGLSRTFQNIELFKGLTVRESLLIGYHALFQANLFQKLLRTPKAIREETEANQKVSEILERIGLRQYEYDVVENLPVGIQKCIELGKALMSNPKLILLDEPAAGLNSDETEWLSDLIRSLNQKNKLSVLCIEHDMSMVERISDHVYVLDHGKIIANGLLQDVQQDEYVVKAYLGG